MVNHKGRNAAGKIQVAYEREKKSSYINIYSMFLLFHWPVCLLAIIVDATNI